MPMEIVSPSEDRVIRFAVGTEDNPTSFVWRLWTSQDDAYLTFAPLPEPKFSMHGEVWKLDAGTTRHTFRPIPCPNAQGWIQGPAVVFCHVPYDPTPPPEHLLTQAIKAKNVRWFELPPRWYLVEFVVFFADERVGQQELPPMDTTVEGTQRAVGPLPLADGRRVWLRQLTKPIPEDRKDYLLRLRMEIAGIAVDETSKALRSLAVILHLQNSSIVAVPFGLETIATRDDPSTKRDRNSHISGYGAT